MSRMLPQLQLLVKDVQLLDTVCNYLYHCGMRHPFESLKLKLAIIESGTQQAKLAEAIGTSPSQISRWVRGHNVPTPDALCAILRAIGWSDERISELRLVDFYPLDKGESAHDY